MFIDFWNNGRFGLAVLLLGLCTVLWAEVPVPVLTARVTDLTGTLKPAETQALEDRLRDFETRKGAQIAVLIVPSTTPDAIEGYSIRVVENWKLGRKGVDDGVLLLVAKDDRRVRIEVGYGLEGVIPDALASRIIHEAITPRFKAGDFHGGIAAGVERLMGLIAGEPLPAPAEPSPSPTGDLLPLVFIPALIAAGAPPRVRPSGRRGARGRHGRGYHLVAGRFLARRPHRGRRRVFPPVRPGPEHERLPGRGTLRREGRRFRRGRLRLGR
ncbi:MAG: TPM domain-containing protein, partial [Gammaproteobacteria bacterium]